MKHSSFCLIALIAITAASCSLKENFQSVQTVTRELTIEARREGGDKQTKTFRDDSDGSVWWTPGDAISLFYGSGTNGGSKFTSTATENSMVTNFTGMITAITGGGEITPDATYFWGLYPYKEDAECDGSSVTMTLPTRQTAVPGTFATNTFPSIGQSQGLIMGFYNVCGGLKFSVTKEGLKKVTLKSNNGELITGRAKIGFNASTGLPEVKEIIDGSDEIVLEAPAGEFFEVGQFYFMVMFPTKFTGGFTVKLETFTEEASIQKTGTITAKRSIFGKLANMDATAAYAPKTGPIPVEDPNFKAYLVENYDQDGDGEISYEEAAGIKTISNRRRVYVDDNRYYETTTWLAGMTGFSLQGIEFMPNLEELKYRSNDDEYALSSLDLSNNPALTKIYVHNHSLSSLDLSNCPELTDLSCSRDVYALDNHNVNGYYATGNLRSLDLTNNPKLQNLSCYGCNIEGQLDLSNCAELQVIYAYYNDFEELILGEKLHLWRLYLAGCKKLTSLDLSGCPNLKWISTYYTEKLVAIDYSFCPNLQTLYEPPAGSNLSSNTSLTYLESSYPKIAGQLGYLTGLKELKTSGFTSLDLSANVNIRQLTIWNTESSASINITKLANLISLDIASYADIHTLNISKNSQLVDFTTHSNPALNTLLVAEGQSIEGVTVNRSDEKIHPNTQIVIVPANGGGEGTGEENW